MSLTQMVKFMPSDEEMAMMDLDVVLYLRISLISLSKEDNYGFIRYFFSDAEVKNYFKDYEKTVFFNIGSLCRLRHSRLFKDRCGRFDADKNKG